MAGAAEQEKEQRRASQKAKHRQHKNCGALAVKERFSLRVERGIRRQFSFRPVVSLPKHHHDKANSGNHRK